MLATFAYDIAVLAEGNDFQDAAAKIQLAINNITAWTYKCTLTTLIWITEQFN